MPSGNYLGQYDFQVVIAPARVGYLIRASSDTGFRRAVAEACTRWGGITEPIVPVRSGGRTEPFWRQVLEFANVDSLVNVDVATADAGAVARRLNIECVPMAQIDQAAAGQFTANPSAVADPAPPSPWAYADPTLETWAVTSAGTFTTAAIADNESTNQPLTAVKMPDQVARAQISRATAIHRTAVQLGEIFAQPGTWPSPAIFWFIGRGSFRDNVMFWNCRALSSLRFNPVPMILVPEHDVDYWVNFGKQAISLLQNRPDEFAPDALFCSLTVPSDRLRTIAESWGLREEREEPRTAHRSPPPPPRLPPFTYKVDIDPRFAFVFRRRYGIRTEVPTQVFSSTTDIAFDNPADCRGFGRTKVGLSSDLFRRYPKRPPVAQLLHPNGHWRDDSLELFSQFIPAYRFTINVPRLETVVTAVLSQTTSSWSLSDKGRIGSSIDLQGLSSALLKPGLHEVVRSLTTRRARQLFAELRSLVQTADDERLAQTVADIGGRIERRSLSATQVEGVPASQRARLLEELISLTWAERGLRISCPHCGITSFVSLSEVTTDARCPGCLRPAAYHATNSGPTVFYRLNALIDRASDQGVLGHLAAVAALKAIDPESHVLPGINVTLTNGASGEVDLFGVFQGNVIAGEVKLSGNQFSPGQVDRDVRLSKSLGADLHAMAWFGEVPEGTLDRASRLATKNKLGLQLLPLDELRR